MLCRLTERVTANVLAQGMVLFAVPSLCRLQVEEFKERQSLSKGLKHNGVHGILDFPYAIFFSNI